MPLNPSQISDAPCREPGSAATKSNRLLSLLSAASCGFMLYSSITAILDSHGDPSTVLFVLSSLSILGLLYLSMRLLKRDRLKMVIRLLAMLLNILFIVPYDLRLAVCRHDGRHMRNSRRNVLAWVHEGPHQERLSDSHLVVAMATIFNFFILFFFFVTARAGKMAAGRTGNLLKITTVIITLTFSFLCFIPAHFYPPRRSLPADPEGGTS